MAVTRFWNQLAVSITFLTRLPFPFFFKSPHTSVSESLWLFGLVGLAIGAAQGLIVLALLALGLSGLLAAVIAVATIALLTGGLHEDGLADVADSLGGGKTPDQRDGILKDPRLGSYGVLALVFVSMAKVVAIAELPAASLVCTLALVHGLSRAWFAVFVKALEPDHPSLNANAIDWPRALALPLGLSIIAFWSLPVGFVAMIAITLGSAAFMVKRYYNSLRGDHLGASQQGLEVGLLVVI